MYECIFQYNTQNWIQSYKCGLYWDERSIFDLDTINIWLLEEGVAYHSSIIAWRIPWMEEPGGLQSIESQRVGPN